MEDQSELHKVSEFIDRINNIFIKFQEGHFNKHAPPSPPQVNTLTVMEHDENRSAAPAKTKFIFALPVLAGIVAPLAPVAVDWGLAAVTFLIPLLLKAIEKVVLDMLNEKVKPKDNLPSGKIYPPSYLPPQNNKNSDYVVMDPSTGQYMWIPKEQLTTPWNPVGRVATSANPGGRFPTPYNSGGQFPTPQNYQGQYPTPQNHWGQYSTPQINPW